MDERTAKRCVLSSVHPIFLRSFVAFARLAITKMPKLSKRAAALQQVELEKREVNALQMHSDGLTFGEIGESNGTSESTARRDVTAALDRMKAENKADLESARIVGDLRLEKAHRAIADKVARGDLAAIDRWCKIQDRRDKRNGADSPKAAEEKEAAEAAAAANARLRSQALRCLTEGELELMETIELKIDAEAERLRDGGAARDYFGNIREE